MSAGTIDLSRDGWKHSFELHTCRHCLKIILRENQIEHELGADGYITRRGTEFIRLPHTKSEVLEAARDGCPVFTGICEAKLKHTRWKLLRIFSKYFLASKAERKRMEDYRRNWKGVGTLARVFYCEDVHFFNVVLDNMRRLHFYLVLPSQGNDVEIFYSLRRVHGYSMDHSIVPHVPYGSICDKSTFRTFTNNYVASDQTIAVIKQLLDECRSSHTCCVIPATGFVPTRLLELGADGAVRLVKTNRVSAKYNTWVSLSYVWGGEQHWKTTLDRLDTYKERIPVNDLPQTISDALTVCRYLGVSYLWVDSLCIVQDDPEDMSNELPTMASIYRHAIFTISAACTRSSNDGFLHHRPFYYKEFPPTGLQYRTSDGKQEIAVVLAEQSISDEIPDPINERSWTFQEFLLSQRVLIYSSRELKWSCRMSYGTTTKKPPYRQYQGQEWKLWDRKVETYSRTTVTFPLDKLVALSAIASTYHEQNEDCKTYLAGLWKEQLPNGLSWSVQEKTPRRRRQPEYIAPSWSWASVNGPISYEGYYPNDPYDQERIEIIDAKTALTLPNAPFGAVTDGSLVIRAKCEDIKIKTDTETYHKLKTGDIQGILLTFDDHPLLIQPDADEDCWRYACHGLLEVVLLKLGIEAGIVLLRVDGDTYRRVATYKLTMFYAPDKETLLGTIHGFEMREVTII